MELLKFGLQVDQFALTLNNLLVLSYNLLLQILIYPLDADEIVVQVTLVFHVLSVLELHNLNLLAQLTDVLPKLFHLLGLVNILVVLE